MAFLSGEEGNFEVDAIPSDMYDLKPTVKRSVGRCSLTGCERRSTLIQLYLLSIASFKFFKSFSSSRMPREVNFTAEDEQDDDSPETWPVLAFADGPLLSSVGESSNCNKLGGLPSFSPVLSSAPSAKSIRCKSCQKNMFLLVEINAPLASDQLDPPTSVKNRDLWLRVLFVFACAQKSCQRKENRWAFTMHSSAYWRSCPQRSSISSS